MENELVTQEATPSLRFTQMVERQYSTEVGQLDMSDHERQLLQHLFIKCDSAFIEANAKQGKDQLPIVWKNINMTKLAIDAVHRIRLGLDALIPGHVFPIAYFNKDTKQYDIESGFARAGFIQSAPLPIPTELDSWGYFKVV